MILLVAAFGAAMPLIAQETTGGDKSVFLKFVEDRISAPGRRVSINGLEGALSSDVRIGEITVSDDEGVWLKIDNAHLKWNQGALLTGHLQIDELTADSIDYIRPAVPPEGLKPPSPEAGGFAVPEFPVAINLDKLSVPEVTFGQEVFGLGSRIGVEGSINLEGGSLKTDLDIVRKDGPGGTLKLALTYDKPSREIGLDLALNEPENGVIANLLNIEGRPAIAFHVRGSGPVDSLAASLTLDAGGERALTGLARLSPGAGGTAVSATLHGPIAELMPVAYRSFFGDRTELSANGLIRDDGGIDLDRLTLSGGELALTASGATARDGFLERLKLSAEISSADGGRVVLPVAGQATTIAAARLDIDYGDGQAWSGQLALDDFDNGDLTAKSTSLGLSGAAVNLADPESRRVTFNADGTIDGIAADDPGIADALGTSAAIGLAGLWQAGEPIRIAQFKLAAKALTLALDGTIDNFVFDGAIALDTPSIAPFSGIANRQLGGAMKLTANGSVSPLTGGFDLALDGVATDLRTGTAALDRIFAGRTGLSGRIGRSTAGTTARNFSIASQHATLTADGRFSSSAADFAFGLTLDDLALLSDNASGALTIKGTARGRDGPIAIDLSARVPQGQLSGRTLSNADVALQGQLDDGAFAGRLKGSAALDGHAVALASDLRSADGVNTLSDLTFTAPGASLAGNLSRDAEGLLTATLDLNAPNISTAAALLLQDAKGAVNAHIELNAPDKTQTANITASVRDLVSGGTAIGSADINADIADLFGVPAIAGDISAVNMTAGGVDVAKLAAIAKTNGAATDFSATATLDNGTALEVAGNLAPQDGGYRVGLQTARLAQGGLTATLAAPAALSIADGTVVVDNARLAVGDGSIVASGSAGRALDLDIAIEALPLSIANTVRPDLGLGGTLEGTVGVSGPADKPVVAFSAKANALNAAALDAFGIGPLTASADGRFADKVLELDSAKITSPGGISATASGTMPLVGTNGDLTVKGTVPLALANRTVGERGTQVSGTAVIDARVTGSLAKPQFGGSISTAGAEVVDPQSRLRLEDIALNASLRGQRAVIDSFTGKLATGGSISASGTVGLGGNLPADLNVRLNSARYADGNLFAATATGELSLTGGLTSGPLLQGSLQLEKAEISIPDLGGGAGGLIDVDHVDIPPAAAATLRRANPDTGGGSGDASPGVLRLDVALSAPNQIFVRGRGLDVELGGSVRLRGNINAIQPVGGFELIRGRMSILGERIVFTQGQLTLVGDLDPYVTLSAESAAQNATVFVTVTGPVSDLDIAFTSQPELPQDEVLSLLIFKRAIGDLSPLQLARLAAAAAELAGGSNNSIVDSLREAAGLDDLDIVTDAEGNTAVRAGRYIQDNVYLNVEAGAQGKSKVSIDLDVTDNVKARASADNDGETSIGVFYEQDY